MDRCTEQLPQLGNEAAATVQGQQAATTALAEVRTGHAAPDLIHTVLQELRAKGNGPGLRAAARVLQKALEGQQP